MVLRVTGYRTRYLLVMVSPTKSHLYKIWTDLKLREETSPLVSGVSRAVYIRHPSKEEALNAYMAAYIRGGVIRRS